MGRQRVGRQIDRGRLGQLASQPGIDPRSWIVLARVDDDDDAIRWAAADSEDGPLGWIVDVTVQGGDLDQEGPIPCRLGAAYARDGELLSHPPGRGCLVLVAMPCGNLNGEPTIIGELPSDGCAPPSSVNGTELDEAYALATHLLVTKLDVDQEIGGDRRVKTGEGKTHRLLGEALELADEGATQPFVLGNAQKSALDTFAQAVQTAFTNLNPGAPPTTPVTAAQVTIAVAGITAAVLQLSVDLQNALSTKIKGA
jgi:hypothetical protein